MTDPAPSKPKHRSLLHAAMIATGLTIAAYFTAYFLISKVMEGNFVFRSFPHSWEGVSLDFWIPAAWFEARTSDRHVFMFVDNSQQIQIVK